MWDEQKRSRFRELRARQREGILSEAEQAELDVIGRDLEAIEAVLLTPATERIRQERVGLETQNRILEGLALRNEALVRRLRDFLAEAQAERHSIERQLAEVVDATDSDLAAQQSNAAVDEPWRATIPSFRDEALFREYTKALKAHKGDLVSDADLEA
jgi:hypothetical protein